MQYGIIYLESDGCIDHLKCFACAELTLEIGSLSLYIQQKKVLHDI